MSEIIENNMTDENIADMEESTAENYDYESYNDKRINLGYFLIDNLELPIIPLYPFDKKDNNGEKDSKAGKVPCIKGWTERIETTAAELEDWFKDDDYTNLGLPLGANSRVIAIDIDGYDNGGKEILDGLSGGDLPDTVQYTTPNGGMRYLYMINKDNSDKKFSKYIMQGESEHTGVELLGDGQQTVLPYSIHPNGGIYEFVEGHSFEEIDIAPMPEWIEHLMLKSTGIIRKSSNSKINNSYENTNQQDKKASKELTSFFSKCPKLMEILEIQEKYGDINYTTWFNVLSLLIKAEKTHLAYEFSELYYQDDTEETERQIEEIEKNIDNVGFICCSTFGCSYHFIKRCHGKVNKDENNSPIKILRNRSDIITDDKTGFEYEKGILKSVNFNIFSRYVHERISVKRKADKVYYIYSNKNFWERKDDFGIKKIIRKLFNRIEPDSWRKKYAAECFEHFDLDCKNTPTNDFDYINLTNGLYNINTKELYEHSDEIFTTSQLPIEYDPEADCPQFKKFIDDVFGEKSKSLKKLVQEIAGYCLTTTTRAEKFFIFHGSGGNGKSILCDIFFNILGKSNISAIPMNRFKDDFTRAQIVDKLANIVTENELSGLETAFPKTIASGDMIQINEKFVPPYNYKPFTKLIFSFNNMPYSADKSDGLERKLIIIPFKYRFVDNPNPDRPNQKKRDIDIIDKLLKEKSGILNWFIEGLERLKNNGYRFTESKIANTTLKEYLRSVNVVLNFVNMNIEESQGDRLSTEELQTTFINWCEIEGHKKIRELGISRFLKELRLALEKEDIPFLEGKSNSKSYFNGIRLKEESEHLKNKRSYFNPEKN